MSSAASSPVHRRLLSVVLFVALLQRHAAGAFKYNRCYSCMSENAQLFFPQGLDRFYRTPKNFTMACDAPMPGDQIGLVSCRTICLTVTQELVIFSQRTGRFVTVRGCATEISLRPINNYTLSLFDRYDVCRDINAADLFPREGQRAGHDSQRVRVCSCLGDRCNASPSSSLLNSACVLVLSMVLLIR